MTDATSIISPGPVLDDAENQGWKRVVRDLRRARQVSERGLGNSTEPPSSPALSMRFNGLRRFRPASLRLPCMASGNRSPLTSTDGRTKHQVLWLKGGEAMLTYERPTLTAAGSFKKVTGVGGHGPKDFLVKKQMM
jgi:hypothetical protein